MTRFGIKLYKIWQETLDIDASYAEIKNKYNILYKSEDLEGSKRLNRALTLVIVISLVINLVTFIIYRMLR